MKAAFDHKLVRETMRIQKVSQSKLALVAKIPTQSGMSDALNGKRQLKVEEAARIYEYLGLNSVEGSEITSVPVIGLASAGKWREAIEMPLGRMPLPRHIAGTRSFAVEVTGDSMDKLFADGGWVVIDPDDKSLAPDKCYLIQNADFEVTVKQYQKGPPRFEPVSTNSEHESFEIGERDFVVLGRVVWKGERL